jgi:Uma2 family endonuclease
VAYRARAGGDRLTIEEFERLPDEDCRMELVRGVVVREPRARFEHGRKHADVVYVLRRHVEEHPVGKVCGAETGFILSTDPPTVRAPDAAFVAAARIPAGGVEGFFPGAPDLAVEIVSPSSTASDIQAKVFDYLDAGARLVWVVYPETRTVAVHRTRAEARHLTEMDVLDGGDVLPGLRLGVARLFAG